MSRFEWLDNIGRAVRSHKDAKLEDFLTQVQRLTLTHENADNGQTEVFKLGTGSTPAEGSSQHTQGHQEDQKKKEDKRVEEGNNTESTSDKDATKSEDMSVKDVKYSGEASGPQKNKEGRHLDDDASSEATKRESSEHVR
jgi:H+-transporting ATPase